MSVVLKNVVFPRFFKVSQLVVGMEWGLWPTVLWFGVNFIHHQRKDTGHSPSPSTIRTCFQLGQNFSLCCMEGEGSVSALASGHFYWFYATGPQANPDHLWAFKQASKRLTNKPQTSSQIGLKETLPWILR